MFRRLIGQHQIGGPLNPGSVAPIFKRVAQWIGMPERFVDQVSGQSTRVGATGLSIARYRSCGDYTSWWMEIDTHAAAVCRENQFGTIWNGARELIRRGWVSGSDDIEILEQQFLQFYCISSLDEEPHLAHAAKKTPYGEATSILQQSWLFRVKHLAKSFVLPEFNRDSLIKNLPNIQALQTAQRNPAMLRNT